MAQSGYTPVQLYRSTTAGATPSAGNLQDGELAINTRDGKLFYKNYAGSVAQFKPLPINAVAAITTSTTLTSTSAGYQQTQMTAIGQSVTLPDATTMSVGAPLYVIDNTKGGYPVGIRDNSGTLLMAVAAGGEAYVALEDNSTAAGVWSFTGTSLEPGLITIDNTLSSTYRPIGNGSFPANTANTGVLLIPNVALDSNTSIHFAYITTGGFAAYIVDNAGKVVTTPVTISTSTISTAGPISAFKISSTQAILFYSTSSSSDSAVVLTVSGSSPSLTLSVGTPASASSWGPSAPWGGESYAYPSKIAQLSSSLYLVCGQGATSAYAMAISVSGSTVTLGTPLTIPSFGINNYSSSTYPVSSTSGCFVAYDNNASQISAVVISVSGTTCTAGTKQSTSFTSPSNSSFASAQMSPTKIMIFCQFNTSSMGAVSFTISGTSITFGTALTIETISTYQLYIGQVNYRNAPICWAIDSTKCFFSYTESQNDYTATSYMSRAVVITESSGTLTAGTITYGSITAYNKPTSNVSFSGIIGPNSVTDFISTSYKTSSSTGYPSTVNTPNVLINKISGINVLPGEVTTINSFCNASTVTGKLSNGDYIICGNSSYGLSLNYTTSFIPVLRPNSTKDRITVRGNIRVPSLDWQQMNNVVVATNRIVVVSSTYDTGQQDSTIRQRILNIEIAA